MREGRPVIHNMGLAHVFDMRTAIAVTGAPENALLARSIFVVDADGRIAYMEIVPELTDHPDYEAALAAVRQLAAGD